MKGSGSATSITITPASNFDGTIEAFNVHLYDLTKVMGNKVAIGSYAAWDTPHPAVIWGGDLYIGTGSTINVISLSDRGNTRKDIIDKNYTIQSITQQAGNLIIWATD